MTVLARRATPGVLVRGSVSAGLLLGALSGRAEPTDPTVPARWMVGSPPGFSPVARVEAERTGRARSTLPRDPHLLRTIRLSSGVLFGVAVDERGRFVVTTADSRVSQIDGAGRVEWSLELGATPAAAPILTSDGTRFVLTDRGDAIGITPVGHERFRRRFEQGMIRASPASTEDDAVIVAAGAHVYRLAADGTVVYGEQTSEPIRAIAERGAVTYVATESGDVYEWRGAAELRPVADLGGRPSSELVVRGPDTLVAVVQNGSLVQVNVRDGTRAVLASVSPDVFGGAPAVTPTGDLWLTTGSGRLLGYRGQEEAIRIDVGRPALASDASPPLVDTGGTVGFAMGATAGVALPSHDVRTVALEGCGAPLGVFPSGEGAMAVVCSSGSIQVVGNRPH